MDIGIISVRYAKALYAFASQAGEEDRVYKEMNRLFQALQEVELLRNTLRNPVLTSSQICDIVALVCRSEKKGILSQSTQRFIALVVKHHRTDLMSFIANSYISLYCKQKHIVKGKLILPVPAGKQLQKRLQSFIQSQTNQEVELEVKVDKNIGGGFIIEYDTYRLDASLRTQLSKLQRSLKR